MLAVVSVAAYYRAELDFPSVGEQSFDIPIVQSSVPPW